MPGKNLPDPPNPSGLCMCGCGGKTSIAKVTIRAYGHLRGHPVRFLVGHAHRPGAERRFWAKVDKRGPDECWEWTGAVNRKGYGISNSQLAHRRAWEFTNGPIPDGLCVCHHCDNPPCCNPACLWLGTIADNNADMIAKGRGNAGPLPGERNQSAKLTEGQVLEIRRLHSGGGWTNVALSQRFGVAPENISQIIHRKTWVHI